MGARVESVFHDFTMTFTRVQILEKLKRHRELHIETFEEARKGYLKLAEERLAKRLGQIKEGKVVELNFTLKLPVNFVEQYDELITAFTMAKEDEVELDMTQMRCILHDKWGWSQRFAVTNAAYLGR